MRVGVHTVSSCYEAAIYAAQLTDALRRRLSATDGLVKFDGRRVSSVAENNQEGAGKVSTGANARFSRILSTCLSGITLERAVGRYAREVDVSHSIGGMAQLVAGIFTIPLIADLDASERLDCRKAVRSLPRDDLLAQLAPYPWISTVSEFARKQLIALIGCDPARVVVIPPGVSDAFRVPEQPTDKFELQVLGLLPQQFFLHVGASDEDGGLSILLRAYADLPSRIKAWLPMVVVSKRPRTRVAIPALAQADVEAGNIRLMAGLPPFLMRVLYSHARLVLFPGHRSQYGLSLADAVVSCAPIAVTQGTANSDIAGASAIQVEAFDIWAWRKILADQVDRGSYCGRRVLKFHPWHTGFSWDEAAGIALTLYQRVTQRTPEFL